MVGPLREALIKAAHEGRLPRPDDVGDDEWRARLARLYPHLTPAEIADARRLAEAAWADAGDDDFGV